MSGCWTAVFRPGIRPGYAKESGEAQPKPATFAAPLSPRRRCAISRRCGDALARGDDRSRRALGARASAARSRSPAPAFRPGHMPGARNVHYAALADSAGRLVAPEKIRELFEEAGVDLSSPVITTCGSGITAACCFSRLPASARTTSPSTTAPGPNGARGPARRSPRGRHERQACVETTVTYLAMTARPAQLPPMPTSPRLALMRAEAYPAPLLPLSLRGGRRQLALGRAAGALRRRTCAQEFMRLASRSSCSTRTARRPAITSSTSKRPEAASASSISAWCRTGSGMRIGPWFLGSAVAEAFARGAQEAARQHLHARSSGRAAALPETRASSRSGGRAGSCAFPPDLPIPGHIAARMDV